jgi:hypothetical protein
MQRKPARPRHSPANAESPTLLQFVFLSMLLHMLLVVLFGNTISGGARRGDGWLGPLDVTLRQMSPERGSGFTLAPGADTNFPGAALLRRRDGSTAAPAAMPQGNAATRVVPQDPMSAAPLPPARASTEVSESAPEDSLSPQPPPVESLPRLDRSAPVEVDKPLISPTVSPPKVSPPAPEREIAPRSAVPPRDVPIPPATPLEPIAPPTFERQVAPPVELRQREIPVAPRPPTVERPPREEPAPVEPIAPAKIEREQAPAVEVKPRDVPMAPIERIAPPIIEHSFAPSVELPTPRKAPLETTAPARVAPTPEREAAPVAPPLPRNEPVPLAPERERAAPAAIAPGKAPAAPTPARAEAPAGRELPRLRFGAPDVDEEVFRSRRDVVAPTTEPGGAPGITAESLRGRTREIAREGSGTSGVLNVVPPPPPQERKDTLAEGIAKAAKPDCRTAYAGMGLLAVVPLVASSVGNGGCRW